MIVWEDATSYSHGERGKKDPTAWATEIGKSPNRMRIVVVFGHRDFPGEWVFHCHELQFDTAWLPETTAAGAKMAALEAVRKRLEAMYAALMSQWPGK